MLDGRKFFFAVFDQLLKFRADKYNNRRSIIKVETDFIGGKPPVDRQNDGAYCGGGTVEEKIVEAVFSQNPDAISLFDGHLLQPEGQVIDPFFNLVKCQGAAVVRLEPCRSVFETECIAIDEIVKRKIIESHGQFTSIGH